MTPIRISYARVDQFESLNQNISNGENRSTAYLSASEPEWLRTLNNFLLHNIHNAELTNTELAEQMYMSERVFYRKLKEETGYTPNHYIRKVRLETARQMLLSGHYNRVKEVAHAVGFGKVSYFSELFQRMFGERPAEFMGRA
ncbi:MAG: helix-turn-helix transcriptional regulator [Saprospiraceae bacterium]